MFSFNSNINGNRSSLQIVKYITIHWNIGNSSGNGGNVGWPLSDSLLVVSIREKNCLLTSVTGKPNRYNRQPSWIFLDEPTAEVIYVCGDHIQAQKLSTFVLIKYKCKKLPTFVVIIYKCKKLSTFVVIKYKCSSYLRLWWSYTRAVVIYVCCDHIQE